MGIGIHQWIDQNGDKGSQFYAEHCFCVSLCTLRLFHARNCILSGRIPCIGLSALPPHALLRLIVIQMSSFDHPTIFKNL
jgi:hypothetical protein